MAGDKHHAMGMLAVRERHAQRRQPRQACRDAVDHGHHNARRAQMLDFFTAPAKNKGVAALEPHHGIAFAHRRDHQLFNERLRGGFAAAALAHIHDAGGRAGKSHDVGADQVIDKQHAGLLNGFQRLEGQ